MTEFNECVTFIRKQKQNCSDIILYYGEVQTIPILSFHLLFPMDS